MRRTLVPSQTICRLCCKEFSAHTRNATCGIKYRARPFMRAESIHPMTHIPPAGTAAPPTSPAAVQATTDSGKQASAIAGDILYGADEIALFLFGERKHRRRVYNLVEGNALPTFRIGVNICARKSVLLGWIEHQERQ